MSKLAIPLSFDLEDVQIGLYSLDDQIYFGELPLSYVSDLSDFKTKKQDLEGVHSGS